ncbi:FAD-dependent oxidoreductase [Actinoplanes sp. NPDC026619]|uniref:FAD-dependent oxidoreductase n=1 Tax=Actinoplanes sp. NPDC026619 TaxID=3155798 RepID=UPI00340E3572
MLDVVVIGGGAMGSAAAWRLAARGRPVALLERFAPGHTRGASHGASRIFRLVYSDPGYIALAQRALPLWRDLEEASGTAVLDITGGVDHGNQAVLAALSEALEAAGAPGKWLAAEEAADQWPGLRFTDRVFFHPSSGRVHADRSVAALQQSAAGLGAEIHHETPVEAITVRGDDHVEVVTAGRTWHARRVVVAVGAWSAKLLDGLAPLPPLRVTEEQPAHFPARDDAIAWPSFIHHLGDDVYGLATPGEGVKVGRHGGGPVVDPDARDFAPLGDTARRLRDYVREWVPGVDADRPAPISCTYTSTPTMDFVLDRVGPVVVAAGFSGHGFKFTPAIGEVLADLAIDGRPAPARFALNGKLSRT